MCGNERKSAARGNLAVRRVRSAPGAKGNPKKGRCRHSDFRKNAWNFSTFESEILEDGQTSWLAEPETSDRVYWERRNRMEDLQKEYLTKTDPDRFLHRSVTNGKQKENFRHLYYVDAGRYTLLGDQSDYLERAASMSYHTELKRIMLLLGEIPRKTMIRHIIILCAPYLSTERLNENLKAFGYQPLDENHTQIDGTHLDWLLIRILKIYADCCSGKDPEECILWLQKCFRILDQFFADQGIIGLRLMHFKALER